jgi:hypothetical protein
VCFKENLKESRKLKNNNKLNLAIFKSLMPVAFSTRVRTTQEVY